jgi:tRNA(Leu) C34 or U34 (ribose-2'-O)-methylase TrmL
MSADRGYFGVAVWRPKSTDNIGTLWRSANIFGASFIAIVGGRFVRQASDTMASHRHVPLYEFDTFDAFRAAQPHGCKIVAVELCEGARDVVNYVHPARAVYLLGPEDGSLSPAILAACHDRLVIPGTHCLNLAVAGSIVLYDRVAKAGARRLMLGKAS